MTTSSITTLELPRFTTNTKPQPVQPATRLGQLAARQRAAIARDGVAAAFAVGFAVVCALGLAGF
jgi:hypothetical protein